MGKVSKAEQTREAILDAAQAEYLDVGFEAARLENIARRCGKNKALIYRYFKNREGLFKATLGRLFRGRETTRQAVPDDLGQALAYWFQATTRDQTFMPMIMREAIAFRKESKIIEAPFRRDYYQRQIDHLERMQQKGALAKDLPSRETFLALTALISWPVSFPQVVSLITGHTPDEDAFLVKWQDFLQKLAEKLSH